MAKGAEGGAVLAVVWAILALRPYLQGVKFVLRTDHGPLQWILNLADATGRLARWRLRLLEYEFEVQYNPGREHHLADAMSRMPTEGGDTTEVMDDIPCFTIVEDDADNASEAEYYALWDLAEQPKGGPCCPEVFALVEEQTNLTPIPAEEFLQEQANDPFCKRMAEKVGDTGSQFDYDHNGYLVRRSTLDGALQKVVPVTLRARVLYLAHYPRFAGHPGGTKTFLTMRRNYYWPLMANDVFAVSRDCRSCAAARGTRYKVQKHLKLFPATGPLEFLAMDLLGPLPKTQSGNEYVLVITDRFTKLCRSVPLKNTKAVTIAAVFLNLWVYAYGAPTYVLTDNGPQFAAKFFEAVCTMIGIKHVFTTAYHPQTNGQVERFNKTLAAMMRHYVAEHQKDWDEFVQPLTYAYNMQVHWSTGTTPFDLVLSRHPGAIASETSPTMMGNPNAPISAAAFKRNTLNRLRYALSHAKVNLTKAQKRYKADFDKRVRTLLKVEPGQMVFVNKPRDHQQKNVGQLDDDHVTKKLAYRTTGPYKVVRATDSTVTIDDGGILATVSLDRVTVDPGTRTGNTQHPPSPAMETLTGRSPYTGQEVEHSGSTQTINKQPDGEPHEDDQEYVVERVVDHEDTHEGRKYRIRWYGYTAKDDTWQPPESLPRNFITRYWNMVEKKRKTREERANRKRQRRN